MKTEIFSMVGFFFTSFSIRSFVVGIVCSMRMFILFLFSSFWAPYSLGQCKCATATEIYRFCGHCHGCFIQFVTFFSPSFLLTIFVLLSHPNVHHILLFCCCCWCCYSLAFFFHIRLTHLCCGNERAQLMVCLDFFCSRFHLLCVFFYSVLAPANVFRFIWFCVCFIFIVVIIIMRMASGCLFYWWCCFFLSFCLC